MKIKKFKARTFGEALELVRKELSEDAIILSTEETKGLRPSVEVTAAVDYDIAGRGGGGTTQLSSGVHERESEDQREGSVHRHAERRLPEAGPSSVEIKQEIEGLRRTIEAMKSSGYEMSLPGHKKAAFNFLKDLSVREEFALRLCENVKEMSDIPLLISSDIRVKGPGWNKKAMMLIGPTGAGKTTTIAKLAAQAVKAGRRAAVVNLDTYRIGAVEQIRIYSRILGIPLATASNAAEIKAALMKFAETRDVIFIDTTGRNPMDEQYIRGMGDLCRADIPMELHLLMSANSDGSFMIEAYRHYSRLPVDYIAFSKIDEAVRYGSLYNLILTYQKPVSYITTGQRVPGDIETATVNRLAGLIVKN